MNVRASRYRWHIYRFAALCVVDTAPANPQTNTTGVSHCHACPVPESKPLNPTRWYVSMRFHHQAVTVAEGRPAEIIGWMTQR